MAKRLVLYNTEDAENLGVSEDGVLTTSAFDNRAPAIAEITNGDSIADAAGGKAINVSLEIMPKLEDGSFAPNYTGGSFIEIGAITLLVNDDEMDESMPAGVYTGTYNLTTGELVYDTYVVSSDDLELTTSGITTKEIKYIRFRLKNNTSILGKAIKCNRYGLIEDGQADKVVRLVESGQLYLYDNNIDMNDPSAILEGLQLLVPLSSPVTIKLNQHDIVLKKGTNVVTSDAGNVTVTYAVDTKTYIDNKFAALSAALLGG